MISSSHQKSQNNSDISICALDAIHVRKISKIHQEELDMGALDLFGLKFLSNMYNELLKDNHGLIAKSGDEIIGFITAIKKDISFIRCLSISSIITFFFNIFIKFGKFRSFLVIFNKIYIKKSWNLKFANSSKSIELFSIAVKKKYQGKGVGKKLIEALEQKARKDGLDEIFTRTHNHELLNFYYKNKRANLLEKIFLQNYILYIVKWKI
tara:strand:+ start:284 stop:913 length:630 start_codon:yes stop_codon:yes gene_type:complete